MSLLFRVKTYQQTGITKKKTNTQNTLNFHQQYNLSENVLTVCIISPYYSGGCVKKINKKRFLKSKALKNNQSGPDSHRFPNDSDRVPGRKFDFKTAK